MSGREWSCQMSPDRRGAGDQRTGDTRGAGVATWKFQVPVFLPSMLRCVRTVTVSPGVNALDGRKLPPLPSESPAILPPCLPLREPVTVMEPILLAGIPRNTIWACGGATWLPGIGKTYTVGAAAACDAHSSAIRHAPAIATAARRDAPTRWGMDMLCLGSTIGRTNPAGGGTAAPRAGNVALLPTAAPSPRSGRQCPRDWDNNPETRTTVSPRLGRRYVLTQSVRVRFGRGLSLAAVFAGRGLAGDRAARRRSAT